MVYLYGKLKGEMSLIKGYPGVQDAVEEAEEIKGIDEFLIVSDEHERGLKGQRVFGMVLWRSTDKNPRPLFPTNYSKIGEKQ
jgi:hypothetical protein